MSGEFKELTKSGKVQNATTVAKSYTPAASIDEIYIRRFFGEAAFSSNSVVKLVWKWDHATEAEVVVWSTKGSGIFTQGFLISDCDGIRKLAIVLENGEDGNLVMSGYCDFWEGTF